MKTRVHQLRRAVLVLGVAVSAGLVTVPPSSAVPTLGRAAAPKAGPSKVIEPAGAVPVGFRSWSELYRVQERMNQAADRIAVAGRREAIGYAGIVAAPENRELRVYWHGQPPSRIGTLLAVLRQDVPIRLLPAPHSERELLRAAEAIKRRPTGPVTSVAARADGRGLTVTVGDARAANAVGRSVVADVAVPVDVRPGFTPGTSSRWNDFAPWWGGGAWLNPTQGMACSTGFAVRHEGRTKMLTAGHCGQRGDLATDPAGESIGRVSQDNDGRDAQLIDARSQGHVYNNAAPGQEWGNPVIGALGSYVGNWVCTSGAFSGTRCGIQVVQTGVSAYFADVGYWVAPVVVAEKADRTSASGEGDSGGSVLQPAVDPTRVYAKGVVSGGDHTTDVPCTGYIPLGRVCSWRMIYVDIVSATTAFGAAIVTG